MAVIDFNGYKVNKMNYQKNSQFTGNKEVNFEKNISFF